MRATLQIGACIILSGCLVFGQDVQADSKTRARTVRDLGKQGEESIPKIARYVNDPDLDVRLEAVKALDEIGGPKTLDSLITLAHDNDPEIQIRATDGIVNVYLPGYLKGGLGGTIRRVGTSVKGKFTDTNDQVIESYIQVRPEAVEALGRLARGGATVESRANAARAVGILRGQAALPDLEESLRSKDNRLMYESLIAIEKIGDPSAAPRITFLLRDLDEKVQLAALEATGVLRNREAGPGVRDVIDHARNDKIKRAAVTALAMLADPADHPRFLSLMVDKDDGTRAAAAEGLGRLKNPVDRAMLEKAFMSERSTNTRLSEAFALAMVGNLDLGEFAPFRYVVNNLNIKTYKNVALAFLMEIAREPQARQALYTVIPKATKDERIGLSIVLARSGDQESVRYLETLSRDPDSDVSAEGIRSLRALRARLP